MSYGDLTGDQVKQLLENGGVLELSLMYPTKVYKRDDQLWGHGVFSIHDVITIGDTFMVKVIRYDKNEAAWLLEPLN